MDLRFEMLKRIFAGILLFARSLLWRAEAAKVEAVSPERDIESAGETTEFSAQECRQVMILPALRKVRPRALGVLLCYNDGDILSESIEYLLSNNHDVIAWDHGSTDNTAEVLSHYRRELVETRYLPREFDFYKLYGRMSEHLISQYVGKYDWISWPDQDEFLEGPTREYSYYDFVTEVFNSRYDWVQFHNLLYWFTAEDDPLAESAIKRVKHYSNFPDCSPRMRAWRACCTNIRWFNHNDPEGEKLPEMGKLRHYQMRSLEQALKRITKDRSGLQRGSTIAYYNLMNTWKERIIVPPDALHFDDGVSELSVEPIFNWRFIYGTHEQQSLLAESYPHPAESAAVVHGTGSLL